MQRPPPPFAYGVFRRVWAASLVSNLGGMIQAVAAAWMMTSLTDSPQLIALVQTSTSLPLMLLSLWAGAVADNLERRSVMLAAQGFMLIVSLLLAACVAMNWVSPLLLLGFTFLIGCGTAVNAPAWQASVGDLVPRQTLPAAVAMNSMGFNIARSVGPAVGGVIVGLGGAVLAFLINAASYVGLIVVLLRWKPEKPKRTLPREQLGAAMIAGLRYVAMSGGLVRIMTRSALFGFGFSAVPAMMPLVARSNLGGGPLTYGLMLGFFGIGAVSAGLNASRMSRRFGTEKVSRGAAVGILLSAAFMGMGNNLPLTLVVLAASGAGWLLGISAFTATVQLSSPRWVVGRAISLNQMATFGAMAAGSWLFGSLADATSPIAALRVSAAVQLVALGLAWLLPLPRVDTADLGPAGVWREPETAVPILPRSGPIVIMVEYRIAREDVDAFLEAMHERRRIRRRDGARNWTMLRDLEDTELWIERYHVATWTDYVRVNERHTRADILNAEELRRLRIGGGDPVVHRLIERQTVVPSPDVTMGGVEQA